MREEGCNELFLAETAIPEALLDAWTDPGEEVEDSDIDF